MLSEEDLALLTQLEDLEVSGEPLKPKQKATLNKLRKERDNQAAKSKPSSEVKTNIFGKSDGVVSTYKVNPTSIRFVQVERDILSNKVAVLKLDFRDEVIDRLGSMSQVSETKLIRAAVLALQDMSEQQIIEYIKQVQRNMSGR